MSYTNTITNGSSVSREGAGSFDTQLADLQDQVDGLGGGASAPSGTGVVQVVSGAFVDPAAPLGASEITAAGGALASDVTAEASARASAVSAEASTRASADTALAAPSYVTLAATATLVNERVLTGTANQITVNDGGAGGAVTLSTPQNIHTGASPTFAGGTLTGAVKMTGTHTALLNTETGLFRDASGQINLQSVSGNYVNMLSGTTQYGAVGPGGLVLTGNQTLANSGFTSIYRDSSGNLNSNVPGGATHIARVAGVRVGGFPLTPSDMPSQIANLRLTTDQTGASGSFAYTPITFTLSTNENSNITSVVSGAITFANAGRYRVTAWTWCNQPGWLNLIAPNATLGANNSVLSQMTTSSPDGTNYYCLVTYVYDISAADVVKICWQSSGAATLKSGNGGVIAAGYSTQAIIERLR